MYASSTATSGTSSPSKLLILLVVAVLIAVGSIPLSHHARTSHANQTWNAVSIQEYMASGKCKPKMYVCQDDTELYVCDINNQLSIGLIVGRTVKQVISGWAAPHDYWRNKCP